LEKDPLRIGGDRTLSEVCANGAARRAEIGAMDESPTINRIEAVIARLRRGDAAARDELLECGWRRLERLARKMLNDFDALRPEVVTGDVLNMPAFPLHRALQEWTPSCALHFFRLAARLLERELIDLARHYKNRPHPISLSPPGEGSDADGRSGLDPSGGTSRDPRKLDGWTELHEEIARLPKKPRVVCELLWYQGLSGRGCRVAGLLCKDREESLDGGAAASL
jgi:hypothetical protein